jgi:hypothetical protein
LKANGGVVGTDKRRSSKKALAASGGQAFSSPKNLSRPSGAALLSSTEIGRGAVDSEFFNGIGL